MNELHQFQLLRPLWLLGLLPVAILIWQVWRIKNQQGAWHQVIAPQFRHLLLGDSQTGETPWLGKLSIMGLGLIWLIAIIALSGPSFKSVELPTKQNQQGNVIVLDLSLSMLADDLAPDRLSRARYKITDLLKRHPELAIGMVGYAASSHAISPISKDNQTLLSMMPALNPVIMPSYGSDPVKAFEYAKTLFEGAQITQGHIIWITDDLEESQKSELQNWLNRHDYSVSILTVGTEPGGAVQIPNYGLLKTESGKIILPKLPKDRFNSLASIKGVTVHSLSLADDSVDDLLPPLLIAKTDEEATEKDQKTAVYPFDEGALLLLLILPFVAFAARRGWLLSLSMISLPLTGLLASTLLSAGLFMPTPSYAETEQPTLTDAFKSPDQHAYQAWQAGNIQSAENLFEDEQWRASSLYRLGQYEEAAELFAKDTTATGDYNRGNALAKIGDLEAAKEAFESALQKQPELTKAQKNLELIEQLLKQQEEQKQQQNDQDKEQQSSKDSSDNKEKQDDQEQSDQQNKEHNKDNEPDQKQDQQQSANSQSSEADKKEKSEQGDNSEENQQDQNQDSESSDNQQNSRQNRDLKDEAVPKAQQQKQAEINAEDKTDTSQPKQAEQGDTADSKSQLADEKSDKSKTEVPMSAEEQKQQEQQQATKNWLKQIPDEPSLFLKRKFEYQYQQQSQQPSQTNGMKKQW